MLDKLFSKLTTFIFGRVVASCYCSFLNDCMLLLFRGMEISFCEVVRDKDITFSPRAAPPDEDTPADA